MASSLDLRKRILKAYEKGEGSIRKLAERYSVSPSTIWCLLQHYKKEGKLESNSPPGRPAQIDETGLKKIQSWLEEDNDLTLAQIRDKYEAYRGVYLSLMSIHRYCNMLKMTYKKTKRAAEQQRSDVQEARKKFKEDYQRLSATRFIVLDESGCHLGMTRGYGRALPSEHAYENAPFNRGTRVTMLSAIGLEEVKNENFSCFQLASLLVGLAHLLRSIPITETSSLQWFTYRSSF